MKQASFYHDVARAHFYDSSDNCDDYDPYVNPDLSPIDGPTINGLPECKTGGNAVICGQSSNTFPEFYTDFTLYLYHKKSKGSVLKFSDGFRCYYNRHHNHNIHQLVGCYMDYFRFNHEIGFGCQRSVLDLKAVFDFIKDISGCDLINKPNTKCKRRHKKNQKINVKSKRNFVKISAVMKNWSYRQDAMNPDNKAVGDGPDFPYPKYGEENSLKVIKRGRFNANYTIEINAFEGFGRLLLILTGKSKLWFRIHCYGCGAWVEITMDCNERVIKYSDNPQYPVHIPLDNDEGDECTLWKGGETKKTKRRESEHKMAKIKRELTIRLKTTTMEPLVDESTTEVPLKTGENEFGDWIIPPGAHGR
ncbi:hypothetical protein Ddc_15241 [Ditylenchus destructor]|nr:hypothetical protein Ddc_15241 [Ditylenchus destructor]